MTFRHRRKCGEREREKERERERERKREKKNGLGERMREKGLWLIGHVEDKKRFIIRERRGHNLNGPPYVYYSDQI